MARTKGSFTLAGAIEPLISAPLDSRDKVATKAELTASGNFPYPYVGMETYVVAEDKKYRLIGDDPTDIENWKEVTEGGGGGTSDYADLTNKPQIEGITLNGNKSASDLGLAKLTDLADFITKSVDDLVNYYTKSQSYSKTEVDAIVTAIKNSRFEVVATLPTSDIKTNVIYLVPSADPQTSNAKDEYINLDGTTSGWEKIGTTSVDLSGYVTDTELNTALANYVTSTNLTSILSGYATTTQLNDVKENQRQTVTYIAPTSSMHGEIWQYLGADMAGEPYLKSGYFYRCDYEGQGKYKWTRVDVQPSGGSTVTVTPIQTTGTKIAEIDVNGTTEEIYAPNGSGGGGHTIEDAEGTDLTQRDTLQFGEGFKVTDDSENEKTKVDLDKLATGELDDIFDDLPPAVEPAYHNYSTVEHKVGTWIDNKPIYEKTIVTDNINGTSINTNLGLPIDEVISIKSVIKSNENNFQEANYYQEPTDLCRAIYYKTTDKLTFILGSNYPAKPCKITTTIQYTKTTDTV